MATIVGEIAGVLASILFGFLSASICNKPIWLLIQRLRIRQTVSQHAPEGHQVKQGTPTMGGLMFVLPIAVLGGAMSMALRGEVDAWIQPGAGVCGYLLLLFVGFATIGFVDDFVIPRMMPGKRGLGWKQKLLMEVVIAVPICHQLASGWAGTVVATFVVLFCSNAYNFADGLDGLATSVGLLFMLGLGRLVLFSTASELLAPIAILAGAMLPFAWLNRPKAKVFMGDVGSLAIGAFFGAVMYVAATAKGSPVPVPALVVLSLVLVAELVPVPIQIFWVKVFKRKLFPFTPIHHAFEKAGWKETRVVLLFASVQAVCSLAAVLIAGGGFR